jgi:N-acetylmuramoyl-L-alanine amidase
MRKLTVLLLLFLGLSASVVQAASRVEGVRVWSAPDHTRLVFDIDGPVDHRLFGLHGPERLVVDFTATRMDQPVRIEADNRHLSGVRHANRQDGKLRVVLDLKQSVRPKSFLLKPNDRYGHRLVIDLFDKEQAASKAQPVKRADQVGQMRDVVIAVDAGHGGEDVGAIGRKRNTYEKDVVLQIARRLAGIIDKEPGMRAVLTRKGDYYIPLRKRMEIARAHHADLFVSIHADAFRDARAKGASVYVLSRSGASSEAARWLAESENAADLVGGVSLDDKDEVLASVLLDLSQSATRQVSLEAADGVYKELKKNTHVHGRRVQQAGFVVLKSPDIPSMLVETGFISNPGEEAKLRDPGHQQKLAHAVFKGVRTYFYKAPPPGTRIAALKSKPQSLQVATADRSHKIRSGDTLSRIAQLYDVSVRELRSANSLRDDMIRVGQVLRIPSS